MTQTRFTTTNVSSAQQPAPQLLLQRIPAQMGDARVSEECRRKHFGLLQRQASGTQAFGEVPAIVHEVLNSPGQPLDLFMRASIEPRFGHDFSRVRVHTDAQAAESAKAVNALAYTVGWEIVFGRGRYRPQTREGEKLLAHELTHVVQGLQQRPSGILLSQPGDASEQEADRAASQVAYGGKVQLVAPRLAIPLIQRQPQAAGSTTEPPDLRQRRLDAAAHLHTSIGRFRTALSGGQQWGFERITSQGNDMGIGNVRVTEPMARRQSRLTQLLADLVRFTIVLESGPVPSRWQTPRVQLPAGTFEGAAMPGTSIVNFGYGPDWEDALRYYTNWQLGRGQNTGILTVNMPYIIDPPLPGRVSAIPRVPLSEGINLGIWIVVPDPEHRPLEYHRLTGTENWPAGGTIFEVWHDSSGYYYLYNQQKHYLPGRPT